jgi:uncharacterized protein (TIGR03546 family)
MEIKSFRPLKFLWHALVAENTPRQLAWGVAIGVLIGFVPKGNLIAVALVTALFALRVNLLAGLITAFVCTWLGMLMDPFFDHIGYVILTMKPLQSPLANLYRWPYVPCTAFNNTVVMGALAVGVVQLIPTYGIARRYFDRRWIASQQNSAESSIAIGADPA